jgi:amino acid adenylation domain-containing protein
MALIPFARVLAPLLDRRALHKDSRPRASQPPQPGCTEPPAIAIIGMAGAFPGAPDWRTLWRNLDAGTSAIREIPAERFRWSDHYRDLRIHTEEGASIWGGFLDDITSFDAEAFNISPSRARQLDPQQRVFLEVARRAIEDAGYRPGRLEGSALGVFVGAGLPEYAERLRRADASPTLDLVYPELIANRVSRWLDARGPSETFSNACCGSLTALHRAVQALATRECDWALAGGVSILLSPYGFRAFARAGVASANGEGRVLDERGDGWVRAEGAGAVLLKPLAQALAAGDVIHAVIAGSAVEHGGRTRSPLSLSAAAQAAAAVRAHRQAGCDPRQLGYLELQGSGTPRADLRELQAMHDAFITLGGPSDCVLSCLKPALGHLEAAAGIAAVIKAALALQYARIPGIPKLDRPIAGLSQLPFRWATRTLSWEAPRAADGRPQPRTAAVNGFAYGGSNAHIVLREAPPREQPGDQPRHPRGEQLLVLSAADLPSLRAGAAGMLEVLSAQPSLAEVAHTLRIGRDARHCRLALLAASAAEADAKLRRWLAGEPDTPGLWQRQAAPSGVLSELGQRPEDRTWLTALWRGGDLERVAALWLEGAAIPWESLQPAASIRRVSLPASPWPATGYPLLADAATPGPEPAAPAPMPAAMAVPSGSDPTPPPDAAAEPRETRAETLLQALHSALQMPAEESLAALAGRSLPQLGVDSLQAQELRTTLARALGIQIPLSWLMAAEPLDRLAQRLAEAAGVPAPTEPDGIAWQDDPDGRFEPFPLTDIQYAYLIGRADEQVLGGQGCHLYWELERDAWDPRHLGRAWNRLIARHDMLRAVFSTAGHQRVLVEVPDYEVTTLDFSRLPEPDAQARLAQTREQWSHECFALERWPLFRIGLVRLPGRMRLLLSIDLLLVDAMSLFLLLDEWARTYDTLAGGAPAPADSPAPPPLFRDYVRTLAARQSGATWQHALSYWRGRLDSLPPPPQLPLLADPATLRRSRYRRLEHRLPRASWEALRAQASARGLTPVAVIAAAFADTLACWASDKAFTLNLTVAQRLPLHPRVQETVGDFTSNLLLAVDLRAREPFAARVRRLGRQLMQDLEHAEVSGARVLGELASRRGQPVLMPVVLSSFLGYERDGRPLDPEALGRFAQGITQTPQVWLDAQALLLHDGLYLSWDAVAALFEPRMLEAMFAAFNERLTRLAEAPDTWDTATAALPADQCARRAAANATDVAGIDRAALLHAAFWHQARQQPDAVAVVTPERQLSYGELAGRAAGIAELLRAQGVRRNELVAVVMEKGWEQVVAVLAVTLAGAAYLPVDASQPARRIQEILALGEVRLALSQARLRSRLGCLERLSVHWGDADSPSAALPRDTGPAAPTDLAYVIFTSGSTGTPKGVMIAHRAAANTVADINRRFAVSARDRLLGLSALSFDLSVYDIFGPLSAGAALVLPAAAALRDPRAILGLIERERVTLWNSVPAYLQLLAETLDTADRPRLASLRLALLSGDWIPLTLPERMRALAPRLRLISLGGATEAAIWSICHPIDRVDPAWRSIPYGKPLAHQRFHVLDERMQDCPDGIPGELYIGGLGVAEGYWGDPERTAASFPRHPDTGERLYRTGDLGRYLPDGNIEFLGRRDTQVKLGGYRVELGEVEARARGCPGVGDSAAVVFDDDHGQRRLALAWVGADGSQATAADVRACLREHLPDYMIPARFLPLERWPLSANGKLDRKALAAFAAQEPATGEPASERSPAGQRASNAAPDADLLSGVLADAAVIKDRDARHAFIGSRPGLRRDLPPQAASIDLPQALTPEQMLSFRRRRSARRFADGPLPAERLFALLGCLRGIEQGARIKYRYPSAGDSHPVQTYLHLKAGACTGLAGGVYYYHPLRHALLHTGDEPPGLAELHLPGNRPVFDGAAFSVFLVADLRAIGPLYGEAGLDLARLEAGHMAQLLQEEAAAARLDLCPIGWLDAAPAREALALDDPAQILLYSLLGGGRLPETEDVSRPAPPAEPTVEPTFEPAASAAPARSYAELEATIAAIWARILDLDTVAPDAQFFEIGGNSFAVLDVQRALEQELDIDCPVTELFRHPTVRALAAWLGRRSPPAAVPAPSAPERMPDAGARPTISRRARRRASRQQAGSGQPSP